MVVHGVGVAFILPLVGGGRGGGSLDRRHRLPHSHISPIPKGLDCITYEGKKHDEMLLMLNFGVFLGDRHNVDTKSK